MQQINKNMKLQQQKQQQQIDQQLQPSRIELARAELKKYENRKFTISELKDYAAGIIPYFATQQKRYKVSDYPDEPTIRYYIGEGLVDKPAGKYGVTALFSRKHLLQILAIKYLQYQELTLKKIKKMLEGLDENSLEDILFRGKGESIAWKTPREEKSVEPQDEAIEDWTKLSVNRNIQLLIKSEYLPADLNKRRNMLEMLRTRIERMVDEQKRLVENEEDIGGDADLSKL